MKNYDVTVSRLGGITVRANSSQEAAKMVSDLSVEQLEKLVEFCGYEITDVVKLPDPVYYYCITLEKTGEKQFFRAGKEMANTSDILDYAVATDVILKSRKDLYRAKTLNETEYREQIISYLKEHFDKERSEYHKTLNGLSVDDVISAAGKIQFYDDIIHIIDEKDNDDEFSLTAVENLLKVEKPLDFLYERYYFRMDFSSTNEQIIEILISEG